MLVALASAGGAGSWGAPGGDFLHALAVQPDGKIVVAGSVAESHVLLERYGTDGRLDASFGGTGLIAGTLRVPSRELFRVLERGRSGFRL